VTPDRTSGTQARTGQRLGAFELQSHLGAGGMGDVYRAWDTRLQRHVALKILRTAGTGGDDTKRRLLREARAAAALDHPNICPIYEVGETDGVSFIVMPYLDGETLAQHMTRTPETSSDQGDSIAILSQVAAALAEAHRHNIIHRDIKPANIMVTSQRIVKVLDFGLAAATSQPTDDTTLVDSTLLPGIVGGTVPYMSPEQIRGEPLDTRTDIFSLGVVAYELLTGHHPFMRATTADTMSAILSHAPDRFDRGGTRSAVRRILHKCLEKNRSDRYATVDELLADLERSRGDRRRADIGAHRGAPVPAPPIVAAATESSAFIGRDAELELVSAAWARAQEGEGSVVLLGGDPGIGKTRIATEFARRCAANGATVLVGRADQEALVPYQPFVEALTWYVRACPEMDLVEQLGAVGGGGELAWIVPELPRRIRDLPPPDPVSPESQRYRLFEVVSELLIHAAAAHPVLLLVDDLHWADKATFQLLRHLLRRPDRAALCVVLTYRESEVSDNAALSDLLAELRRDPAVTQLSMRGLNETAVVQLVASIGGTDAASLVGRIVTESTGGNPLFVGEIVRHLIGTGALGVLRDVKSLSAIGVPQGVKDVISHRLARLTDACRRVMTVAAVVGRDFDLALLAVLEGTDEDSLLDVIDEAIRAHTIAPVPGAQERFTFTHALVRETLYDELTAPRRTRLHRRIGETLEKLSEGRGKPPLADLAHHFVQAAPAGQSDKAIRYSIQAGDAAVAALVFEDALRFYDMALQTLGSQPSDEATHGQKGNIHSKRALAFRALGQWSQQKLEVERALECLNPEEIERRAELTLMLADAAFFLLDRSATERWAVDALALAGKVHRDDIAADATGWLARCQQAKGDLTSAIELDRRAVALGRGAERVVRIHGGHTLYLAGRLTECAEEGLRYVERARASHDAQQIMFATPHLGLGLGALGRYTEALKAFDAARAFGHRYGVVPPLARSISMSAGLHLMLSDFPTAKALASEAREMALSVDFNPSIVSAGIDLLFVAARTGEYEGIESLLQETTRRYLAMPGWHEWLWRLRLQQAKAELALAHGALDSCVVEATEALQQSRSLLRPKYQVLALMTRGRALLRANRRAPALADARLAVDVARRLSDPALLVQALALLSGIEVDDALMSEARRLVDQITSALPASTLRQHFSESEPVKQIQTL